VRRTVLVAEIDGSNRRHVDLFLDQGSIRIEGQDIGLSVEDFWGSDEYEWAWKIDLTNEAALRELLAIAPSENLVNGIVSRYSGDDYYKLSQLLSKAPFETNFWSHA
jgi:hypothetical protein